MIMKTLLAIIAALTAPLLLLAGPEPVQPADANSNLPVVEILIARLEKGTFADIPDTGIADRLKGLAVQKITCLSAVEAGKEWKGGLPLLEAAKNLIEPHLLLSLKDDHDLHFHQVLSPVEIGEGVLKGISDALNRHSQVVGLVVSASSKQGEERLLELAKIEALLGAEEFLGMYPAFTKELLESKGGALQSVRDDLAVNSAHNKVRENSEKANRLHFDLSMIMRALPPGATLNQQIEKIDQFIKDRNLEPEMRQVISMRKYLIYSGRGMYEEALKVLEVAREMAPETALAGRIQGFKDGVKARMVQMEKEKADHAANEKNTPLPQPAVEPPR